MIRKYPWIRGMWGNRMGWFRIFGWGLQFSDKSVHGALFSERFGIKYWWHIGNWGIAILKRSK